LHRTTIGIASVVTVRRAVNIKIRATALRHDYGYRVKPLPHFPNAKKPTDDQAEANDTPHGDAPP